MNKSINKYKGTSMCYLLRAYRSDYPTPDQPETAIYPSAAKFHQSLHLRIEKVAISNTESKRLKL